MNNALSRQVTEVTTCPPSVLSRARDASDRRASVAALAHGRAPTTGEPGGAVTSVTQAHDLAAIEHAPCACCWDELTYSNRASSLCARCRIDGIDYPTWAFCQREAGYNEALITRRRYLADTAAPTRRTT